MAAYEGQLEEVGFTVTVYANSRVSWIEETPKPLYSQTVSVNSLLNFEAHALLQVEGAFSLKNAGGHHGHQSFMDNPQYHLRIYPAPSSQRHQIVTNNKATTFMTLRSSRHLPVNVALVWSKGERVTEYVTMFHRSFRYP